MVGGSRTPGSTNSLGSIRACRTDGAAGRGSLIRRRRWEMVRNWRLLTSAGVLLAISLSASAAQAEKTGGVLKVYFFDSPASMSIHEEATIAAQGPMMGVFNNLVMYKQDVPQTGFQSIIPDLATDWSWDEDKTHLTFRLRDGVKWHDGKPFT